MKLKVMENNATSSKTETMKKRRRCYCCIITLATIGTILASFSILLFTNLETAYDMILDYALRLDEASEAYKVWRKGDPLPMDIYMFNWTNPKDIYDPDIKPRFEEIGPYRFLELREKVNITWNANNTISYRIKKTYLPNLANPGRNLSDVINILNMVPLSMAYRDRHSTYFSKRGISSAISIAGSPLYVTKTVEEILFTGYTDNILSVASLFPFTNVPDKFGYFYGRNGTIGLDGVFSMWTKNDDKFGSIQRWNYGNQTQFYGGSCNDIKGSAGEFYPKNTKRDHIQIFSPELCKSGILEYDGDVEIKGVRGYKFTSKNLFDNGTLRPEYSCFCQGECIPSGVLNVSHCREDTPVFLSLPHFLHADPYYTSIIDGMQPDEEKHDFFMTLDPKSSISFDVAARMQLNLLLQPIEDISLYEDIKHKVFVPIFYFDQRVPLSDELAGNLRAIQGLPNYFTIAAVILITLGFLCLVCVIISVVCLTRTKYPDDYKVPQDQHEEIPLRS